MTKPVLTDDILIARTDNMAHLAKSLKAHLRKEQIWELIKLLTVNFFDVPRT